MIKKNKTRYTVLDPTDDAVKSLDVKEIYSRFRKRPGCSKYLLCVNVKVSDLRQSLYMPATGTTKSSGYVLCVPICVALRRIFFESIPCGGPVYANPALIRTFVAETL